MRGDRERCLLAGMDGYLAKPIDPEELFAVVEGMMEDTIDAERLRRRVEGNRRLFERLVRLAIENTPGMMATVRAAATGRDRAALGAAVHSLRGAMAVLAGQGLGDVAARLETLAPEAPFDQIDEMCSALEDQFRRCLAGLELLI